MMEDTFTISLPQPPRRRNGNGKSSKWKGNDEHFSTLILKFNFGQLAHKYENEVEEEQEKVCGLSLVEFNFQSQAELFHFENRTGENRNGN